jgi:hypothetical protein
MRTAIFIKSYPGDYRWLGYCLRSIKKYVTGFSEVVVAVPEGGDIPKGDYRTVHVADWTERKKPGAPSPGYYHQMFVKLCADLHCNGADYVFLVDSDCVFREKFDISEMFAEDGRPKLLRRTWEEAGEGKIWKKPAEEALGWECPFDTMVCHPTIYHRDEFPALRKHIETLHSMPFEDYVKSRERFIEFVTMGNFILKTCPDKYKVIDNATDAGEYPSPLLQHWSWGGMTPEITRSLKELVR